MIELLKTIGPILIGVSGITAAVLLYINTRGGNRNVADKNRTDKYQILDAKQEQIAEMGFRAADEANKRADRIAAEMQLQVAKLQEQLDQLDHKLKEQTAALVTVRQAHAREIAALKADYEKQIDAKNRRIYALEDAVKGQQGDRQWQTVEGDRQMREGERQTEEGKRQTIEGDRLEKMRDENDAQ